MDREQNDLKSEWVRRVLRIDLPSRSPSAAAPADEGLSGDSFEGPAEQAALRGANYTNLLIAIDAELKELATWRDPGYFTTAFAGDKEVKAFIKNQLPALEHRYQVLKGNEQTVATLAAKADFPALQTHIDAAASLLGDITTAARDIGQLVTKPQQENFKDTTDTLARLLKAAPDSRQTDVDTIETRLAGIGDGDVNAVKALIAEASTLVEADKLRGELKDALTKLAIEAGKFPTPNPVTKALDAVMDATAEADSLAAGSTRNLLWSSALSEALAIRKEALAALTVRAAIMNTLHVSGVAVDQTPKAAPRRAEMADLIKTLLAKIGSECAKATKVADVRPNWAALTNEANTAATTVTDWAKSLVTAEKVVQDLDELRTLTTGQGFEAFARKAENAKTAAAIRQLAGTDRTTLAPLDATKLRALDDQAIKALKTVMKVLVDTADPQELAKEMDAKVASGEEAKSAADVEFWKCALEKRLGFKINIPDGVDATKLPKLYELISRMPPSQAIKDLVDTFDYDTQAGPCSYSKRKIVMTNMAKEIKPELGHKLQYPTTDGTGKEMLDYFSLLTLHEIGHAVDDKAKTMPRDPGANGPGGWKNESFDDVVAKFAALMRAGDRNALPEKDVVAMAREFLLTGKVAKPPSAQAPLGSLLAKWDALTAILTTYKGITIAAKTPWETPVVLDGGRCYHEGYAGRWYSYEKGRRDAMSVSDYQWRAPGEWFAELYAWTYIAKDPHDRATRAAKLPADVQQAIAA